MATNEPALRLYRFEGESYCKALDVLRMIHHEMDETDSQDVRTVLSRMQFRTMRNELIDPTRGARRDNTCIPGRYAVAWPNGIGYKFYAGQNEDKQSLFTNDHNQAKLYVTYRDASACADFMDDHDCCVLDMHSFLSEADRFRRELLIPYDADEGNEEAVVPAFVP